MRPPIVRGTDFKDQFWYDFQISATRKRALRQALIAAVCQVGTTNRVRHEPQNVADAVVFLASDRAAFTTGSELVVDGGMVA